MLKMLTTLLFSLFTLVTGQLLAIAPSPPHFVFIIPSYNNEKWAIRNISSCTSQTYRNWHLYYIDDCSGDNTASIIKKYIEDHNLQERCTLIENEKRKGALANIYNAIMLCQPTDIIVTVDGDDFLIDTLVLEILASYYSDGRTWMTYGDFICNHPAWKSCCRYIPSEIAEKNKFRQYKWVSSHLRTFYAKLFQLIKKEDLMWKGKFFPMTWDMAFMFPMLEMSSRGHFKFIPRPLYLYNVQNPLNDYKVNAQLQRDLEEYVRNMKPYKPLKKLF
jgi:glycosyltransferase involved in cell wall biosynthesis